LDIFDIHLTTISQYSNIDESQYIFSQKINGYQIFFKIIPRNLVLSTETSPKAFIELSKESFFYFLSNVGTS
jgi:hypothetical protein